jgi:hypothetical protein
MVWHGSGREDDNEGKFNLLGLESFGAMALYQVSNYQMTIGQKVMENCWFAGMTVVTPSVVILSVIAPIRLRFYGFQRHYGNSLNMSKHGQVSFVCLTLDKMSQHLTVCLRVPY